MPIDSQLAAAYDELLPAEFLRPVLALGARSVWAQYTARTHDRDRWLARLRARDVSAMVYYPRPLHRQLAYAAYPTSDKGLVVSERLANTVISLPMHPYLAGEDLGRIAEALTALA
jgi:dTDP-4-amino-4,6-dideoxygalactose transaminase